MCVLLGGKFRERLRANIGATQRRNFSAGCLRWPDGLECRALFQKDIS